LKEEAETKKSTASDMENSCYWMQRGNGQKALALSQERHSREHSPSSHLELGVALLWMDDYASAAQHFAQRIQEEPKMRSEGDYLYLGTAQWCVGEYAAAAKTWQAGIKAPYAIGGVCTHSPLMLIVASILSPGLFDRAQAEEMLATKVRDPRAAYWPGTLAQYVAGLIEDAALEASWVGNISRYEQGVLPDRKWLTTFYKALLELGRDGANKVDFRQFLQTMVEPSQFEPWSTMEFYELTRHQEFYIARHETIRLSR
jgi:tetratricopeptide (TPR) repeat protein